MQKRICSALVIVWVLAVPAAAQETPDDDASSRPCERTAHAGP